MMTSTMYYLVVNRPCDRDGSVITEYYRVITTSTRRNIGQINYGCYKSERYGTRNRSAGNMVQRCAEVRAV